MKILITEQQYRNITSNNFLKLLDKYIMINYSNVTDNDFKNDVVYYISGVVYVDEDFWYDLILTFGLEVCLKYFKEWFSNKTDYEVNTLQTYPLKRR